MHEHLLLQVWIQDLGENIIRDKEDNCTMLHLYCLSMEPIRLGGSAHRIVTKTVHKTARGGGGPGVGG